METTPSLLKETGMDSPRRGGGSGEEGSEEDSDAEDSSSNLQEELNEFRQRWQRELQEAGQLSHSVHNKSCNESVEDQAKSLFTQGMQAEEDGALYEAIYYYRRSMQLVPDIESKMDFIQQRSPRDRQDSESSVEGSGDTEEDLVHRLSLISTQDRGVCQAELDQRATHISALPTEVLMYIFRWVISSQLDLRSLEMLSMVCKGFYVCARDENLWRTVCLRLWGKQCGSSKKHGGWRRMFLDRPHLQFTGCYISRATYIRQGEQSVDSFYRPFHMVAYYRVLRFFAEGLVLMMCSPEEPTMIVPRLRSTSCHMQGLMRGRYKLSGSKVMCVMRRVKLPEPAVRYKRRQAANANDCDQTYTIEFEMTENGRRACRLNWVSYCIRTQYKATGEETVADFELKESVYPPLIFSRVRSYTSTADWPLE